MDASTRARAPLFLFSTAPHVEPTYTFSGAFGGSLEGQGMGLALAAVRAALNGGALQLSSVPGRGTTAILTLPLATHT
jgi:signal transduction histidine kinase